MAMMADLISSLADFAVFLEAHDGAVVAVATVFIAIFTLILAWVTGRLAKSTKTSIELARAEFTATFRPKIIVRRVFQIDSTQEDAMRVRFSVVNIGGSAAHVFEHGKAIESFVDAPPSPPSTEQTAFVLKSGETRDLEVEIPGSFQLFFDHYVFSGGPKEPQIHLHGFVRYRDGTGETIRETAFLRRYDGKRFIPSQNSDYEYQD